MKRIYLGLCLFVLIGNQCLLAGLNDGLVAYYPFNGNANDVSGNGKDGIVNGATLTNDRFGNPNSAYRFTRTQYIQPSRNIGISGNADRTISLWFEADNWGGYGTDTPTGYMVQWGYGNQGYTTILFPSPPLAYRLSMDGGYDCVQSEPVLNVLGAWHHLVWTYTTNIGHSCFYLDGKLLNNDYSWFSAPGNLLYTTDTPMTIGHPDGRSFEGVLDEIRIYNRALSAPEVQQLYSLPDIGRMPTPLTVVQTNRTPTSAELGNQTNGILEVFTNGTFVVGIALDPNKKTVVLTHGWRSNANDPTQWPWEMAELLQFQLGSSALNIVAWNWPTNAFSPFYDPWAAAGKTPQEGLSLGENLLAALGSNYSKPIHFIGHSFGTLVNADAADYLQTNGYSGTNMQMTLFDEAEVGSGSVSNTLQTAATTITTLLANNSGSQPFWYHPLPNQYQWADNYITAVGLLHPGAANVILTNLYPNPTSVLGVLQGVLSDELIAFHAYPMSWYDDSLTTPYGSLMGFRWSFEENHLNPPPATNTYFIQAFSGSDLDLVTTDCSSASQLLNARVQKILTPRQYALVQTVPGILQAVNQVQGDIQDAITQDPYALTAGLPEAWGINVNLTTSSSSGSSSPAPQIKAHPLGSPNDSSSNTNLPAFVWIPLAVPSNAISMSFDFMFQGNGNQDSFAAALNGTNIFSLATALIQPSVTLNSGQIDMSQYAGTNVELFLGIVGGTSTNANVTVSSLRFYSIVPPSLQAQTTGNNFVLTWPLSASDYALETSTDLTSWTTNADVPVIVDLQNTVSNGISDGARFYRLKK